MIIRVGGGSSGLKKYLETGQKVGRELHRDQLDQRIPLFGDLNAFELITSMQGGDAQKYGHITLSFDENHISDELLQTAFDKFRNHALAAYSEEERDGVLMYAEAHRPRTLSYTNSQNNEEVQRFVHIHIGIGKKNLETGRYCDPLGYLGDDSDNQKYLDAFQESFNLEFGLSSPKDNPRIEPETAIDIYARYTGEKPDALGSFVARKSDFEINLQKQIIDRNITNWADFGKLLGEYGIASKMKEGKFGECWKIQLPGETKAMRLKSVFFQKQFIERPTAEKVSIVMDKAKVAYIEKMQPRKEPKYIAGILDEWKNVKSKEIRYKSSLNNKAYKESSAEQRIEIIKQIESKNHGIKSPTAVKSRKITTPRNRVPGMPVRDLDGIQSRAKMLLQRDGGLDVRAGESAKSASFELRQAARRNRIIQPSSVLAQIQHGQRERYEQAADKEKYAEIRQNLDCVQLLKSLSHTNKINPDLYDVIFAQDGSPRIKCGSRALTPSDFLTKELGLIWKDAAQILRKTYEQQIERITPPPVVTQSPAAQQQPAPVLAPLAQQQPLQPVVTKPPAHPVAQPLRRKPYESKPAPAPQAQHLTLQQRAEQYEAQKREAKAAKEAQQPAPVLASLPQEAQTPPLDIARSPKTLDVVVVSQGSFSGKILSVADGLATQRINRQGDTVQHDVSRLSAAVVAGDVVDVQYRDGVGVVGGLSRGAGVGR